MRKGIILFTMLIAIASGVMAQQKIYDEQADGMTQLRVAMQQAAQQQKYVLCQVGGNWCPWCLRFAAFADTNRVVHPIIDQNFVYIHVNYSSANRNLEAMKFLGNPARFGFPVFVIINEKGEPIHIQNSAYLEQGKGYDEKKVADFLRNWTRAAVETIK